MKFPLKVFILLLSSAAWCQNSPKILFESEDVEYEYEEDKTHITVFDYQDFEYDYIKIPDFTNLSTIDEAYEKNNLTPKEETKTTITNTKNFEQKKRKGVLRKIRKNNKTQENFTSTTIVNNINKREYRFEEMDSIWKNNLYNSSLYNSVYEEIKNYNSENISYTEISTDTLMERLRILDERTPFDIEYNPILENVIKKYLKNRRSSLEKIISKSFYYFPLFEKELDKYNIPMELKYLAVVESALIPRVKSHVGATGLWQFMYETGKMQKLKINSYVDERMDPLKATKAACEYLIKLHNSFNDWDLALAAYNSGPGNVLKAIRRSGGKRNYWNLRHYLPRETAGYLPAFLATMYIFEYAKEHGLRKSAPKYVFFETDTVKVKKKVTFNEISRAIDIDLKDLKLLNPSYKINVIPKSTKNPYSLRLPLDKINDFIAYEEKLYGIANNRDLGKEKSMYHNYSKTDKFTYVVRSGDYLGKIASRFKTSIGMLKSWNNLRSSTIKVGQKLTIYNKKKS